jgi:hypothetical protein
MMKLRQCEIACVHVVVKLTAEISGGFRGGRAGRAPPPLKFAKHMLYNVN